MVYVLTAAVGLAFGSFANVLIERVPDGYAITGRSRCARCRRELRWWELVPVLSAFVLRHRCRTCGGAIPWRLTAVEFGTAALFALVLWRHGGMVTLAGAIDAFGLLVLGILALIDLQRGIVPDVISIPAIVILAVARITISQLPATGGAPGSVLLLTGASVAIGAGFFSLQRLASRGRWVGDGDVRVGALMGALLPPSQLLVALGASYTIGGAVAAVLLMARRVERKSHVPLVPFLWVGTAIAVFWGERVLAWYRF